MFNMNEIGRRIAELRKKADMTQLELADRLGVRYQAVSNWERGSSMPDIMKLPELASIFDTTIDKLLGERSELVLRAAEGGLGDYMERNEVSPEELQSAAPLLKPTQVKEIFEKKEISNMEKIVPLLPFLAQDDVDQLAEKEYAREGAEGIKPLLPFMTKEKVDELAEKGCEKNGIQAIQPLLPFMTEDKVDELAEKGCEKNGIQAIQPLLPFMTEDKVDELAVKGCEKNGIQAIQPMLPFMSEDRIGELANEYFERGGIEQIKPLFPFMEETDIAKLARKIIG